MSALRKRAVSMKTKLNALETLYESKPQKLVQLAMGQRTGEYQCRSGVGGRSLEIVCSQNIAEMYLPVLILP